MNAKEVLLEVQKTIEDWAVVSSINQHQKSPLPMPHILRPEADPTAQDLAVWFCGMVRGFAVHDVRPDLAGALRHAVRPAVPRAAWLPRADSTNYGTRCARDLVRIWRQAQRENGGEVLSDALLTEVLDHTIAALSNTIAAARAGDAAIIGRAVGNMEATFRRVSSVDLPSVSGHEAYPAVVDDAASLADLRRRM